MIIEPLQFIQSALSPFRLNWFVFCQCRASDNIINPNKRDIHLRADSSARAALLFSD
jgi:hypothetical protein